LSQTKLIQASKLIKQIFIYMTAVQHIPTMLFLWLASVFSAVNLQTALIDSHVFGKPVTSSALQVNVLMISVLLNLMACTLSTACFDI
jgi:hypothetical protein